MQLAAGSHRQAVSIRSIVYSKWDRSPDLVEDQVTYPIVTSLLGAPKVKAVRGLSDFGYSYVYVIFEDGTDRSTRRLATFSPVSRGIGATPTSPPRSGSNPKYCLQR